MCKLKKDCIKAENLSCCGVEYPMPERCFKPKPQAPKSADLLRSDDTPGSVAKPTYEEAMKVYGIANKLIVNYYYESYMLNKEARELWYKLEQIFL